MALQLQLEHNSTYDEKCLFCNILKNQNYFFENEYAFVLLDKYPVTERHSLIVPKRHFADYFDMTKVEKEAVDELIIIRREQLLTDDSSIEGFNVGVNIGEVAGQTILHCHIHLIPRRKGDISNPAGGVRGVIPSKMFY